MSPSRVLGDLYKIQDHVLYTNETAYEMPRDSVDKCVDWMIGELDKDILSLIQL